MGVAGATASPPAAHALLEVTDGNYVSDADVAACATAALATLALASLSKPLVAGDDEQGGDDDDDEGSGVVARLGEELDRRLDVVEPLEVRLDVTTLWCYALGRELFYVPPGEDAPRVKPP